MGFLSFAIKDRKPLLVNIGYITVILFMFLFVLYSIPVLHLQNGKEYYTVIGRWNKAMGIELKYNIKNAFVILFLFAITIAFLSSVLNGKINHEFRSFVFIMLSGANGLTLTNDIFNSYVFFEVVCITSYIMYGYGNNADCLKNTYNYMILSGFVGVLFLICIGFLYQITDNLNIDLIKFGLKGNFNNKSVNAIFILFIIAMMFKIGVYPLHNILSEIYKNLPTKYLIFTAGISSIAYPYFILKMTTNLFGNEAILNNDYLCVTLKIFGGIGFIFFNITALAVKNVLHFIIMLSFAQTSLFAFCIPFLTEKQTINGIIFTITSNGIIKVCLLAILYKIQEQTDMLEIKKTDISSISCLSYKFLFVILLFFAAGMPFSLVFMAKWFLLIGIFSSSANIIWLIILITGFTIDIFACFLFMKQILMKKEKVLEVKADYWTICAVIFVIFVLVSSAFFTGSFR